MCRHYRLRKSHFSTYLIIYDSSHSTGIKTQHRQTVTYSLHHRRCVFTHTCKEEELSLTHGIHDNIVWLITRPNHPFVYTHSVHKTFCRTDLFIRARTIHIQYDVRIIGNCNSSQCQRQLFTKIKLTYPHNMKLLFIKSVSRNIFRQEATCLRNDDRLQTFIFLDCTIRIWYRANQYLGCFKSLINPLVMLQLPNIEEILQAVKQALPILSVDERHGY